LASIELEDGKKLGRPTLLVDKQRVYDLVEAKVPIAAIARELGIARSTVRAKHAEVAAEKAGAAGRQRWQPPEIMQVRNQP
jgi:hypothetical protein